MLDTTSYADKLPLSLNGFLQTFAGNGCIMVRKLKEKDKLSIKGETGNCHINVKKYVDKHGGSAVSGWLLNRIPQFTDNGMYVWSFHTVWNKPDGKLLDVTDDKYYVGRDKSIFTPDSMRVPDLTQGISYNNFVVFTETAFAKHYGKSISKEVKTNTHYWCDSTVTRLLEGGEHSGIYRLLGVGYYENEKRLCEEYEIDLIGGRPVPKPGSKYENTPGLPIQAIFDYSISTIG